MINPQMEQLTLVKQIDAQSTSAEPSAKATLAAGRGGRLLVIDDDRLFVTALERTLGTEHDCQSVQSAEQALVLIGAGARFDVILCDLMMPDMSGMDLHCALRRSNPEQAERIIFLTGGAFTPGAQNFIDSVPNLCLEKPFDVPHLRWLVNERIR